MLSRNRSSVSLQQANHGLFELNLATRLMEDAYGSVATHHAKTRIKVYHTLGHLVNKEIEYGIKHKLHNEKGLTALSLGITGGITIVSVGTAAGITASTHGIATPLALAGLAAGTWAASQVADVVVDVVRSKYRRKRLAVWLQKYPTARPVIEREGEKLLLIHDACETIRRAVDHYAKAASNAQKLVEKIRETDYGRFTNCTELTTVVKRQMKFTHELHKTELYLIPALDLGILLKNTQRALCEDWSALVPACRTQIGKYLRAGDHSRCGKVCYAGTPDRPQMPRRPIKPGSGEVPDGIMHFGDNADLLQRQLDQLVALREWMMGDLQTVARSVPEVTGSSIQRFEALLVDAATYYDKPGPLRRSKHYVRNAYTRRTTGELVTQIVNRGTNLMVGVGTSSIGSVVGTNVLMPEVGGRISSLLMQQMQATAFNAVTHGVFEQGLQTVANQVGGATVSAIGTTAKTGAKVLHAGAKLTFGLYLNKKVKIDQVSGDVDDGKLTEFGKDAGDNRFKKAVRHLQQAMEVYQEVAKAAYLVEDCSDAMDFGKKTAEFVWHVQKSMTHLDRALNVVEHMVQGMVQWNAQEHEVWSAIEGASLRYLAWGADSCDCRLKDACYCAGSQPHLPRRRLFNA